MNKPRCSTEIKWSSILVIVDVCWNQAGSMLLRKLTVSIQHLADVGFVSSRQLFSNALNGYEISAAVIMVLSFKSWVSLGIPIKVMPGVIVLLTEIFNAY